MATIRYANQNAIRNDPLSPELYQILLAAAEAAGISAVVVGSGGQEAAGEGGSRTGSTRHDHGNAGDIKLLIGDRTLDFSNPQDIPIFQQFVAAARQGGATGFGAGSNYMGNQTIHVGFGTPDIWGGTGRNPPPPPAWLDAAFNSPSDFTSGSGGPMAYAQTSQPTGAQAAAASMAGNTGQDATSPAMSFPILDRIKARMGDKPTPLLDKLRTRLTEFRTNQMERWGGQPVAPSPPVMPPQPSTASQLTPGGPWEAGTMPQYPAAGTGQQPPASPAGANAGYLAAMAANALKAPQGMGQPPRQSQPQFPAAPMGPLGVGMSPAMAQAQTMEPKPQVQFAPQRQPQAQFPGMIPSGGGVSPAMLRALKMEQGGQLPSKPPIIGGMGQDDGIRKFLANVLGIG